MYVCMQMCLWFVCVCAHVHVSVVCVCIYVCMCTCVSSVTAVSFQINWEHFFLMHSYMCLISESRLKHQEGPSPVHKPFSSPVQHFAKILWTKECHMTIPDLGGREIDSGF